MFGSIDFGLFGCSIRLSTHFGFSYHLGQLCCCLHYFPTDSILKSSKYHQFIYFNCCHLAIHPHLNFDLHLSLFLLLDWTPNHIHQINFHVNFLHLNLNHQMIDYLDCLHFMSHFHLLQTMVLNCLILSYFLLSFISVSFYFKSDLILIFYYYLLLVQYHHLSLHFSRRTFYNSK